MDGNNNHMLQHNIYCHMREPSMTKL